MWSNSRRLEPAISPMASDCWLNTPTPLPARTGFAHRARTRRQHPPANKAIAHYFSGAFLGRMSRVLKLEIASRRLRSSSNQPLNDFGVQLSDELVQEFDVRQVHAQQQPMVCADSAA